MLTPKRSSFLYTAAASALFWSAAGHVAHAQSQAQPDPAAESGQSGEIIVTGSRVARSGFDAPTPTTTLSAEEFEQRGLSQLGDFLLEVPSFRATQTPQTNPQSARGAGQYFADLRGLGSIRTLTLVNGRRHVPSAPDGQVDLNLIPSVMVSRIDVVTGGASAQWGSDAISGVVNIILDNNLEGFKADLSYGITTYEDSEEFRAALAYGTRFAQGRGRFVIGAEFVENEGVLSHWDRPFGRDQQELVSYTGARPAGAPSRFYASGVTPSTMTWGGTIIGPNTAVGQPLRGIQFGPGGTLETFNYGTQIGSASINFTGGEPGFSVRSGHTLVLPVEREVVVATADFDVNNHLTLFAEASYAHAGSNFTTAYSRYQAPNNLLIQRDNAFLPADLAAIMDASSITSFSLGRENKDFGPTRASNFNTTQRITVGALGDLGDGWTWDAYYQWGQNDFRSRHYNLTITPNLVLATDAVDVGGQIVCRNVAARAAGCVPINLFGFGSPSPQALAYVNGDPTYDVETSQSVLAANIRGEPFSTWAGLVSIAAGVEHREEESISVVDALSQASAFIYHNPKAFEGEFSVTEGYIEAVAPLLANAPLARAVDLNVAARYADYSSTGGAWTWKAGLTWDLTDDFRIRTTRSRDFRAPNNSELFAETSGMATLTNPFSGASVQMLVINRSSPTLQPEESDTLTLGVVYSPSFIPGLRLSADYFDIEIAGAIAAHAPQNILQNCLAEETAGGPGFFCGFITRTGSGAGTVINNIQAQLLNLAGFTSRGIDFEAAYRFDLAGGEVGARLVGTYTMDLISDDGVGAPRTYNAAGLITSVGSVVDRAGQVGGFNSSSVISATNAPDWVWSASLSYRRDNWSAMLQGRYVDGGLIDASLVGPGDRDYDPASPISIGDNRIDSRFYVNASASYELNNQVEFYGVVNNVGNELPPFPYTASIGFYDRLGRSYKAGVRFTF